MMKIDVSLSQMISNSWIEQTIPCMKVDAQIYNKGTKRITSLTLSVLGYDSVRTYVSSFLLLLVIMID